VGSGAVPQRKFFMKSKSAEFPVVVQEAYEFSVWIIQKVENFPRSYRFSVGDRLVQGVLHVLLRLVDAAYSRDKLQILADVNELPSRMNLPSACECPAEHACPGLQQAVNE